MLWKPTLVRSLHITMLANIHGYGYGNLYNKIQIRRPRVFGLYSYSHPYKEHDGDQTWLQNPENEKNKSVFEMDNVFSGNKNKRETKSKPKSKPKPKPKPKSKSKIKGPVFQESSETKKEYSHYKQEDALMKKYTPKTKNQVVYQTALESTQTPIVVCSGPAGTGKTAMACTHAIKGLENGLYERIILTRPVTSVDEEIGFLPGTMEEKMEPWTRPLFDIFYEHITKNEVDDLLRRGKIEICPLAFMRGRTFHGSVVIADEMQNSSPNQMMMLTTRVGKESKLIVTGDHQQCDKDNSGLSDLLWRIEKWNSHASIETHKKFARCKISVCKMQNDDVQRSKIVEKMLMIWGSG